ncbi:MAG: signal peptidase II [Candidatus Chromulinivorax sp.]|nr:signal peptidase II [Candidatus Chromulinivorax sp.]
MNIDYRKYYALLATLIVIVDRWTKHIVMYDISHYKINQFASIDLVFNRGISFGMFHSDNNIIFAAVNIVIGCVIAMLVVHSYERLKIGKSIVGEISIFAGAISNIVDRCMYGGVVDFIALSYLDWHFAVFNVADVFIFCGVMLMLILEYSQSCQKY